MDNKTLKSSIKAYCLELMKEMNSLGGGGEGAYMTKFAGRKVTSKDKTSPTGFETSPKNNYYKKFKFKVVNPKPLIHSKQLWNEIKINSPLYSKILSLGDYEGFEYKGYYILREDNYFHIYSVEQLKKDSEYESLYYSKNINNIIKWINEPYSIEIDDNEIYEIKINNPGISKLDSDNLNKLKDLLSIEIKDIIEEDIHSLKYHILENDKNFQQFVINDMIHNNFHFLYKNQEILLSHSNQHLLKESTILNYFKNNTELQNFLFKIILEYFFDDINILKIYKDVKDKYFLIKKKYQGYNDVITDVDLKYLIMNEIDFDDMYLWDIIYDFHFFDFLNKQINNYK